ncbi:MAG: CHRD domain-containing protein [Actinobacteria bacterium]|nr:CHRD domain-containing protein [Actinomycetota bacterium]MBA3562209.1 CHRD domain-containing protein [Actinomycetota bacterium]
MRGERRSGSAPGIIDHPEQYYVNVHNAPFPGGAVRGQLSNRGQS